MDSNPSTTDISNNTNKLKFINEKKTSSIITVLFPVDSRVRFYDHMHSAFCLFDFIVFFLSWAGKLVAGLVLMIIYIHNIMFPTPLELLLTP